MWNYDANKTKKKQGGLLESAFYNYKVLQMSYRLPFVQCKKYVCDHYIRVGINIGNYVLAATPILFGDTVSVNQKVWRCRKPIILYLGESHSFYLIKQKEALGVKQIELEKVTMVNFSIKFGANLNKLFCEYTPQEKEQKAMGF